RAVQRHVEVRALRNLVAEEGQLNAVDRRASRDVAGQVELEYRAPDRDLVRGVLRVLDLAREHRRARAIAHDREGVPVDGLVQGVVLDRADRDGVASDREST